MIYNLIFTIIGLCFMVMLLTSLFLKRRNDSIRSKLYRLLIVSSLLYALADVVSIYTLVYSFESKKFLTIIWNFRNSCVFVYVLSFFLYYKAVTKNYEYKSLFQLFIKNKLFLGSFIYILIAVLLSTFNGKFPNMTPDNIIFTSGKDVIPVMIFIVIFSFLGFLFSLKYRKTDKKIFNCFFSVFVLTVCLVPLQLIFSNVSLQPCVSMFLLYVIYHYIENPDILLVEEVSELKANIDSSSNSKTDFLFKLSSDLLLPINTIVSLSESLNSLNTVDDVEKIKFDLTNIKYAGSTLLDSIDNILNSSNENGANSLREYRFYGLIKKVKSIINSRIGYKKITFDINIDDNISSKFYGEDDKIQKILLNILNNAVKYTEVGKIILSVSASLNGDVQTLHFKISDTGCGIKDEEKSFIFSSNSDNKMGLYLSKNYVESMNGSIRFESSYGVGTTFYVDIPQKVVGNRLVSDDKNEDDIDTKIEFNDLSNKKILIVDDDKLDIKVIKRLLENYKVQIFTINSTVECIDKVKMGEVYDMILLDHKMPVIDGVETMKILKRLEGYTLPKIICFTANVFDGASEYYKDLGFDDYLGKPIDAHELDRIVKKI